MSAHHHPGPAPQGPAAETLMVPLDDVFCCCCGDDLGAAIRRLPHVVAAHVDAERKVAHVTVHAGMTVVGNALLLRRVGRSLEPARSPADRTL